MFQIAPQKKKLKVSFNVQVLLYNIVEDAI